MLLVSREKSTSRAWNLTQNEGFADLNSRAATLYQANIVSK